MNYNILLINFFLAFSSFSNDIHDSFENLVVGATIGLVDLNTAKSKLFLKDFKYLTPSNEAKQTIVHPNSTTWNWNKIDKMIAFANENSLALRIHGPVSL